MTSASVLSFEFRPSSHLESVCKDLIEITIIGYKYLAYFSNAEILLCFFGYLEVKISIFTLLYVFKLQIELCRLELSSVTVLSVRLQSRESVFRLS